MTCSNMNGNFMIFVCFQIAQMKQKDARIKLMNEVLNGIKVLSNLMVPSSCSFEIRYL